MRSTRARKRLSGALAAVVTTALASPALAADPPPSLALDRFDPAPAGDRMFGVESPFTAGHLTPHAMVLFDYAHNPLVLRTRNTGDRITNVVDNQLFLHINGSFALWNKLNINLDIPAALLQTGELSDGASFTVGGQSVTSPSKAEFGDLRLGLRYSILGGYYDIFQLAIGGYVWFPTGAADSYVSDGTVRGRPEVIVGGRNDMLVWSGSVGVDVRGRSVFANVDQGSNLRFGGGVGFLLGQEKRLQIGPELYGSVLVDGEITKRNVNAELLVDGRYRITKDLEAGLGVGPGLSAGVGTPNFRGVLMIAYTPQPAKPIADRDHDGIPDDLDACPDVPGVADKDPKKNGCPPPSDRDHDGIIDELDACPDVAGLPNDDPKKNGCPPPSDRDHDGIPDDLDACPDVKGVPDADPKKNGCPPDRDGDGIIDAEDACPDLKGVADKDPTKNGCPPDTDGDTIRDDKDACPKDPGPPDQDPKKNGCPTVRVSETEVLILEQVQFDTAKATIKKVSDELLDKVAKVLKDHPELKKLEIQGHTDNKGNAKANEILSQQRADAVLKAMVKRGIDAKRLTAKGYGQNVPIATNDTEEGRQQNRRVQFKITEKGSAEKPPADKAPAPATPAPKAPAPKTPAPAPKAPAPKAPAPAPKAPAPAPKTPAPKAPKK
ncbi:MAG: OmpA family protein [Byssovorax sp.]